MDKSLTDILLYFIPAVLVLGGMFIVIKRFLDRDRVLRTIDMKKEMHHDSLPLRLQAIERLVLFLERISPDSILTRVHRGGITAGQLHSDLLATIRAEFEHNLSQQIYVSDGFYKTTGPIVIDGSAELNWNSAQSKSIALTAIGTISGASDLSASYKIIRDNTNLYLLVKVRHL